MFKQRHFHQGSTMSSARTCSGKSRNRSLSQPTNSPLSAFTCKRDLCPALAGMHHNPVRGRLQRETQPRRRHGEKNESETVPEVHATASNCETTDGRTAPSQEAVGKTGRALGRTTRISRASGGRSALSFRRHLLGCRECHNLTRRT